MYQLVARNNQELEAARTQLSTWVIGKLNFIHAEIKHLEENLEIAIRNKWKVSGIRGAIRKQRNLINYYEKIKAATDAGYFIIPNMFMNVFAVRVDPQRVPQINSRYQGDMTAKPRANLPVGAGEYAHDGMFYHCEVETQGEKKVTTYHSDDYDFEVPFPVVAAEPIVLEETGKAMALKIFDEVGLITAQSDPMVAGTVKGPNYRTCMFVIAWWLDLRQL